MKKVVSFSILILFTTFAFGQSTTILPQSTTNQTSTGNNYIITSGSDNIGIMSNRFNGMLTVKTPVTSGQTVLNVSGGGYWAGGATSQQALMKFIATENYNAIGSGTKITFLTTVNGGTVPTERMVINHDGNVGVGISTPLEKLHVVGNIRSSSLAGVGVRNVYADANGTITNATQTRNVVISPMSFQRMNNSTSGTYYAWGVYGDSYMSAGATDHLIAPIILPIGAIITGVTFTYTDTSPTSNFKLLLLQSSTTSSFNTNITTLFQNTTNINPFDISSISSGVLNETVVAGNYYYFRVLVTDVAGTSFNSPWANYMSVKGVDVTYTY